MIGEAGGVSSARRCSPNARELPVIYHISHNLEDPVRGVQSRQTPQEIALERVTVRNICPQKLLRLFLIVANAVGPIRIVLQPDVFSFVM